jgi:autotransporter-associated beta strand protein
MNLPKSAKKPRLLSARQRRNLTRQAVIGFAGMALAMLSADDSTHAASGTWTGLTDGLWSAANGTNWTVAPAPGASTGTTNADTVTFNSTGNGNTTITIDSGRNIKSLLFDTAAANYVFGSGGANGGNALVLTSGGSITLASSLNGPNVVETFNAPVTLAGSYSFTNSFADAGSALVFNGNISNTATSTLTLSGAGTGTGNLISGNISDGAGVQSVTFSATNGTWTLSGANSYSGATSITGANSLVVMVGSNSSAGATILNNATATLQLDSNNNGGLASGLLTLTTGKMEALGADRTLSNAVSLQGVTAQGSHSLSFTGKVTGLTGGSRGITNNIASGNTLTLTDIDINSDTTAARSLTVAGTGNTLITGTIANGNATQANGLTITSTGITTLSGTSNYTGATSLTTAGATLTVTGTLGNTAVTLGNTTATLNLLGVNALNGTASLSVTSGTANLAAANSYSGATSLTGGNVNLGDKSAFGSSTVTMNATTLSATTDLSGANAIANAYSTSSSSAATTFTGSNNLELSGTNTSNVSHTFTNNISGGTLTLSGTQNLSTSSSNNTFTINGTGNTVVNGVISNGTGTSTASALAYTGNGTLTLATANSYGGTTTLGVNLAAGSSAGILRLSGTGMLGPGAVSIFSGTLDINGLTRTLGSTLSMGGGPTASAAAITIGAGGVLTLGGNFTFLSTNNPGGAVISGGILNLGAPRTFTIGDSVNAPSDLTINSPIGDGNGIFDITKSGSGTLEYTPNIDLTTLPTLTPTATVSTGTLQLDGAITGGNGIFGVIKAGAGTLNYARNLALTANETVTVAAGAGTLQFSGIISGSFGLTASNPGGLISLTGANTYTGNTVVNGGGQMNLSGPAGSVAFSNAMIFGNSILNLDSSAAGGTGTTRAQSISLFGNAGGVPALLVTGNSGANSIDRITNALTAAGGLSIVTLQPDPAQNAQLQANSLVRNPGATVLFRGTNLGVNSIASATSGSANVVFTSTPTLLGGGGAAGTTTMSILPGAIGDTSPSGAGNGTSTGGLVTYDPATGIRLLNTNNEYKASITDGQTQLDNVRLAETSGLGGLTVTLSSNTTINSLSFNCTGTGTDAGITINGGAGMTLTVASGVIYASSSASSATGNAQTINVPTLSLNGREGTIIAYSNLPGTGTISTAGLLNITSAITNDGGNGVTIAGNGTQGVNGGEVQFSGSAPNTYTGTTTVNRVILKLSKNTGVNAIPGDLVLNSGAIYDGTNQIADTSNVTINGGTFYQNGSNNSGSSTSEAIGSLTLNGGTISPGQGSGNTLTILGTMTLNGSGFTTSTGGKLNVGGLATFAGGTLTLGISNSPSTYANVASFSSGIAIVNPGNGAYTPITINAGSANLGSKLVLSGDLSFTGNATNTSTATINGTAGTSPGIFVLDGTRSFNVGDGAAAVDLAITAPLTDNGANAGGLTKTGNGTLKLTAANTYTGPTTVRGGTLEVSGSLNGSTTAPVNVNNGTLVLSAGNVVSSPTSNLTLGDGVNLTHGTLKLNDSLSGISETFGNLNVEFTSTIDFGALNGNSLIFAGVGDHAAGATLSIVDWSGTPGHAGSASDDRLLFVGSDPAAFTSFYNQSDVTFNGVGGYMATQVDPNHFEIVAIPEPTPVALELSIGILGLIGFRRRRRTA